MEKKFTKEEKLKIIKEASEQGVKQTLEKYSVFSAVIMLGKRKWKQWARVSHGMTPDQQTDSRTGKENKLLKDCYQKELEAN
jgi:putative transposase